MPTASSSTAVAGKQGTPRQQASAEAEIAQQLGHSSQSYRATSVTGPNIPHGTGCTFAHILLLKTLAVAHG